MVVVVVHFSQKQLPRKTKTRLVILECAGYIIWQLFFVATIVLKHVSHLDTGIKKCPDGQEAADHLTCKECREGYYKGPSAVECQPVKAGFISVDSM